MIGRLAEPASERATKDWLEATSGLDEFLGCNFEKVAAMQLYRASDVLQRHREAIEGHLFTQALDLFDLAPTITLYDLTNSFLEGSGKGITKAASWPPAAYAGPGSGRQRVCTSHRGYSRAP